MSVLGALMLAGRPLPDVLQTLRHWDFYREPHRRVYLAITNLIGRAEGVDGVTVANELEGAGQLRDTGGREYIHSLVASTPHIGHAGHYARIVSELARRRRVLDSATRVSQLLLEGGDHAAALMELRARLDDMPDLDSDVRPIRASELLRWEPEVPIRLMEPAFMVQGGLTVLAAPTKVGKTNLWLHIAWALTEKRPLFGLLEPTREIPVLMLQLELTRGMIQERLAYLSGPLGWTTAAMDRFTIACDRGFVIDDPDGRHRIGRAIETADPRPEIVIIDSWNKCVSGDPDKTTDQRRAIAALRRIQQVTGVTIGATSEIRKQPAGVTRRWTIDELKGNNDLAYDADTVVLLKPLDNDKRRLGVQFEGIRHGEVPENFTLVREGLMFSAIHDDPVEAEETDRRETFHQLVEKIRSVVAERGPIKKMNIRDAIGGRTKTVLEAVDYAKVQGFIDWSVDGYVPGSAS